MKKYVITLFTALIYFFSGALIYSQSYVELTKQVVEYYKSGEYEKALSIGKEALLECEKTAGKDNPSYFILTRFVGAVSVTLGKYQEALPYYRESHSFIEKFVGKENADYTKSLDNIGNIYMNLGMYNEALPLYTESLQITKRLVGEFHPDYAQSLNNLANLYVKQVRYEDALPLYEKALNIRQNEPDNQEYAVSLNNIAYLYVELGRYDKALPLYENSLKIFEKVLGKNHKDYATSLNNLGVLYVNIGQYEKAFPVYQEAINLRAELLGLNSPEYAVSLNNLAALYVDIGRYNEALNLFEESIQLIEKNKGKQHPDYATNLNNIASLYKDMGNYEKALPLYKEAMEIREKVLGKNHSDYAASLNNIGVLYDTRGEYEKALPYYEEALLIQENILGKNHPSYGAGLNNIALAYKELDRYEEAVPLILEANDILMEQIENVFQFSSEKEKKGFFKLIEYNYKFYQSFNFVTKSEFPQINELVYNNNLTLKGILLKSTNSFRNAVLTSNDSSLINNFYKWQNIKSTLAKEYSKSLDNRLPEIDTLEKEANLLESILVRNSKEFNKENEKTSITWDKVKEKLKVGEAAIEFSSFRLLENKWTDEIIITAYIVKAGMNSPVTKTLCNANELKEVLNSSTPMSLYAGRGAKSKQIQSDQKSRRLYELLIAPIEEYLEDVETIYYSPDGVLHQIALAAIPVSEDELLCEKYNLVQLGSTGSIASEIEQPETSPILLAGGINFDFETSHDKEKTPVSYSFLSDIKDTRGNMSRGSAWNYLPGTKKEIEKLLSLFGKEEAILLTDKEATEEAIKALDGNSPKVLHLATHGFFFENPQTDSNRSIDFNEEPVYKISEDPLMRSGLVLAGGNYAWKNGGNPYQMEDGILTAYEISNLNLSNTDLVVLSACETGLGDIEGSEGVYGLQRAFKMAGVDNIIMSLWEVPDAETVEFMESFYTNWLGGMALREAFQETQREMLNKYRSEPEKWAAFVLVQ